MKLEKYSIIKADPILFSKYYATYRKNVWFRPSWNSLNEMLSSSKDCYWAVIGNERVAGAYLPDESIGLLISLPSHSITKQLVHDLKEHILNNTNSLDDLWAYNILPEQKSAFLEDGFVHVETRECMIRPTEAMTLSLNENFNYEIPCEQDIPLLVELLEEAFDHNSPDKKDKKTYTDETLSYFQQAEPELLKTSTVIYNKNTKEMAGLCLVSLWEGLPLIYDIAVRPKYRRNGLASFMLDRAINMLEPIYPVVRLFVTTGNNAAQLYTKKGFLSGGKTSTLKYNKNQEKTRY
ncbi:GNAT family N-acetyltransferase [Lederbergia sp. NSJ-179]|uniref:GNAT family N-acetyltransferase n=1 Tax=Lederbergia sp. NSJ-179 TaxID=2931402 RepID=UPI001FD3F3F3|nr:N-acetyltransferase [Lederbergia sp. NSJ-179]MCJ7841015.1 GNAT family N-acetyltransferase [Lederbergia sp. NSJ-179]